MRPGRSTGLLLLIMWVYAVSGCAYVDKFLDNPPWGEESTPPAPRGEQRNRKVPIPPTIKDFEGERGSHDQGPDPVPSRKYRSQFPDMARTEIIEPAPSRVPVEDVLEAALRPSHNGEGLFFPSSIPPVL
jgi:hypothetical protein